MPMLPSTVRTPRATWESDSSETPTAESPTGLELHMPPNVQPVAAAASSASALQSRSRSEGSVARSQAHHPHHRQPQPVTQDGEAAEAGAPRYGGSRVVPQNITASAATSSAPSPLAASQAESAPSAPRLLHSAESPTRHSHSVSQAAPPGTLTQSQPSTSVTAPEMLARAPAALPGPSAPVPPLALPVLEPSSSPTRARPSESSHLHTLLQRGVPAASAITSSSTAAATLRYRTYGSHDSGASRGSDTAAPAAGYLAASCPAAAAIFPTVSIPRAVERPPSDDVEAVEYDQGVGIVGVAAKEGAASSAGGGGAAAAGGSCGGVKLQHPQRLTAAPHCSADVEAAADGAAGDSGGGAARAPLTGGDAATPGGADLIFPTGTSALGPGAAAAATLPRTPEPLGTEEVGGGSSASFLQLSVSVLSSAAQPQPQPQPQPASSLGLPAADATAAAVGLPVMLLPASGTADGVAVPNVMVIGRPAAAALGAVRPAMGGSGVGGLGVVVPEGALDAGVDAVASITIAAAAMSGSSPLPRRGIGSRSAAALAATTVTTVALDSDDSGDAGPGALPSELRRRLRNQLGRSRMKNVRTWKDLSYSVAGMRSGYWLVGTMLLVAVLIGEFMFMAGQYEFLRSEQQVAGPLGTTMSASSSPSTSSAPDPGWGPSALAAWLAFWRQKSSRTFGFEYLRLWGGRYAPDLVAGEWWRWVTSLLAHQSTLHLASNLALLLVLSTYLESLYGCWRVLPVFITSGVAGNMVSAFFENPCTLVVGSSGSVFGLLGAYIADAGLNFESIPLLWLRLLGMAMVVALIVALQLTGHGGSGSTTTSHASHVGGFLTGLLLAVLLLPDFKARRSKKVRMLLCGLGLSSQLPERDSPGSRQLYSFWQRRKPLSYAVYSIAALSLLLLLLGVPMYLYLRTFRRIACG